MLIDDAGVSSATFGGGILFNDGVLPAGVAMGEPDCSLQPDALL